MADVSYRSYTALVLHWRGWQYGAACYDLASASYLILGTGPEKEEASGEYDPSTWAMIFFVTVCLG